MLGRLLKSFSSTPATTGKVMRPHEGTTATAAIILATTCDSEGMGQNFAPGVDGGCWRENSARTNKEKESKVVSCCGRLWPSRNRAAVRKRINQVLGEMFKHGEEEQYELQKLKLYSPVVGCTWQLEKQSRIGLLSLQRKV